MPFDNGAHFWRAWALSLAAWKKAINLLINWSNAAKLPSRISTILNDLRSSGQAGEEKASESRKSMAAKASMALEDSVEQILNRFNVPTRGDIEALSSKITQLTERIQTLKKQNGG